MPQPAHTPHTAERSENGPGLDERLRVLIPTHTTRHLGLCLASLARQTMRPGFVAVTCDVDDPAIGDLLNREWPRIWRGIAGPRPELLHIARAHQGGARLNQVRNNALRGWEMGNGLCDSDLVVVLDGDTMLHERALERHAARRDTGAEVLIPFRVNLSETATSALVAAGYPDRPLDELMGAQDRIALQHREARYRRQAWMRHWTPRWMRLVKVHKPKVLGGHHAVTAGRLRQINGFDEQYVGYGYDDDDLTERLYRLRPRVRIALGVTDILAFHLWHPSRAPKSPTEAPGYARFREPGRPLAAERGWRTPMSQPEPTVRIVRAD